MKKGPKTLLKDHPSYIDVLKRVSLGSKDCTKELKLECAYFLDITRNNLFKHFCRNV